MIWFLFQKVGFFVFCFLTIKFVLQKKHENLVVLFFWGMVFANCFQYVFTIWSPTKVVSIGMLISLFLDQKNKIKTKPPSILRVLTFVFFIIIFVSDLVAILLPKINSFVKINPTVRLFLQNFAYLVPLILLKYGSILKKEFYDKILPKFCLAIEVAIVIALVHFVFNKIGVEFAPILRIDGFYNDVNEVVVSYGGNRVNRLYGFSGEPKNLGFTIIPYLVMMFFLYFKGAIRKSIKYHLFFLILGFFVVFNTYSSSVLIALILSVVLIFVFFRVKVSTNVFSLIIIFFGAVLLYLLINSVYSVQKHNQESSLTAFYERTFGRAQNELNNNRQETIVYRAFSEAKPTYQLFGYGIGQYTFHVPGQTNNNKLIPMQSGLVLTLVDFGILGVFFYLFYGFIIIKFLLLSNRLNLVTSSAFFILTIVSYIGSLIYGSIITSFMFFMIAMYKYNLDRTFNQHNN
jgi:hypothetical protein